MSRAACTCLLTVMIWGCSSDVGPGDGGDLLGAGTNDMGGPPSNDSRAPLATPAGAERGPYADFFKQVAAANCERAVRCGAVGASELSPCEAAPLALVQAPPPYTIDDGITAGRAVLSATVASGCVGAINQAGCGQGDSFAIASACRDVIKGSVANGAGCRAGFECAGGFCASSAVGCAGTCKAFVSAGFSCMNAACDAASYCDATQGVCVARGAIGSPCDQSHLCQNGLVCRGLVSGSNGAGACGEIANAGGTCTTSAECNAGLWCDVGTSKCAQRLPSKAACTGFDACQPTLGCIGLKLPNGTSVGSTGVCALWLDLGKACDPTADETGCPGDSVCSTTAKICQPIGAVDSPCMSSIDCRPGLYCRGTGTCAQLVPYGAACNPSGTSTDNPCSAGTCDPIARACLTYCF